MQDSIPRPSITSSLRTEASKPTVSEKIKPPIPDSIGKRAGLLITFAGRPITMIEVEHTGTVKAQRKDVERRVFGESQIFNAPQNRYLLPKGQVSRSAN